MRPTGTNGYEVRVTPATIAAFLAVYTQRDRYRGDSYDKRVQDVKAAAHYLRLAPTTDGGVAVPPEVQLKFLSVFHRNDDRFGVRELQTHASALHRAIPMLVAKITIQE